jgi:hypothetical protein
LAGIYFIEFKKIFLGNFPTNNFVIKNFRSKKRMTTKLKRTYDTFLETSPSCERLYISEEVFQPSPKKIKISKKTKKEGAMLSPSKIEYSNYFLLTL